MIDPVRVGDDPAPRGLPEDLGQPHDRDRARGDDVGQDLPRADGRQLVDIANN